MTESPATTPTQTRGSNAEILGSAYEALSQGNVAAVFAVFSEDIAWHISGRNALSGDYVGHDEVLGFFQALGERSNGTFALDVHEIIGGDETVVALVTEHAAREDATLDDATVHVWRFEDGKAVSFRCFPGDEHAQDAFWSH